MITIEELKQRFIDGSLDKGLFSSGDKIVIVKDNGFEIRTVQENDWTRVNAYTYVPEDDMWVEEELYEK